MAFIWFYFLISHYTIIQNDYKLSEYFYEHIPQGCVNGHNIVLHPNLSIKECKIKCNERPDCLAIEYGVDYGANGNYKAKDCQLQNGANKADCDGKEHNMDLYVKKGTMIKSLCSICHWL